MTISRWIGLSRQPWATSSVASQSSSSGCDGGSPRTPKSLGVATIPRPKWCCQSRLTITRAVSGLSGRVSQRGQGQASAGGRRRRRDRLGRKASSGCEARTTPGRPRARPSGPGSSGRPGGGRTSRGPRASRRPAPSRAAGGRGMVVLDGVDLALRAARARRGRPGSAATASATSSQVTFRASCRGPRPAASARASGPSRGWPARPARPAVSVACFLARAGPCGRAPRSRPSACLSGAILRVDRPSWRPSKASLLGLRGDRHVDELGGGEERLEAVVVGRRQGVELVVVAAGAADRQAEEDRADGAGDLGQLRLPLDRRVDVPADDLARARTGRTRWRSGPPGRPGATSSPASWRVDEPVVGHVGVEGVDDPVAIPPGVGPLGVELEAVRVGVVGQVEPVLRPALAVPGLASRRSTSRS